MDSKIKLFGIILVLIALTGFVNACSVDLSNINLETRVEGDYLETISAENNDEIDIRISFIIDDVSGTDCASTITAKTKIYRLDDGDWDLVKTTSTKTQSLEEGEIVFIWSNEFEVNSNYERYKIEGIILEGTDELDVREAFIDVEDNSCSGIQLITENFIIDEGRETTKTFRIENNTNQDFDISNLRVYFTNTLITSGSVDYTDFVGKHNNQNISVSLNAGNISYDQTISGTFAVSGYLGNTFCSETQIGRKTFQTTVRNVTNNYTPTSSSECNDLRIVTRNIEVNENTTTKEAFYLQNNSNKRFQITNVSVIDSGLTIKPFYFEEYVFPGNIGDIILELNSNNVFQTSNYEQVLRVSGKFSDGKTCSYSNIGDKKFFVTINDLSNNTFTNCENFSINTQTELNIENSGKLNYSITNNTGKKAIIQFESNLSINRSSKIIPNNSSISDELIIGINEKTGKITFKTIIEGCNITPIVVNVTNTAKGNLESVSMSTKIEENDDEKILRIIFNNPTTKTFLGVLRLNLEGQVIDDRIIAVPSGESYNEFLINKEKIAKGSISFVSNGEEQKLELNEAQTPTFTGLFAFGINYSIIGLILLITIVVIVLIIVFNEPKNKPKENWE